MTEKNFNEELEQELEQENTDNGFERGLEEKNIKERFERELEQNQVVEGLEGVDLESIPPEKIKIVSLEQFVGKQLSKVAKYIVDTYSDTHYIPDIELLKWILEEYDNAPDDVKEKYKELKDGNYQLCFGSITNLSDGSRDMPCMFRDGPVWHRGSNWLDSAVWDSSCRVVLLEK